MATKEFKVNDYITLKLEEEKTMIYVKGKRFRQCKFLLLDIPIEKISSFNEIESIDEAANKLDHSLEPIEDERFDENKSHIIPPEVEFWGHCSNLQVWSEYNYDTRLLHSNLAFPLLKKLVNVGDLKAKKVFKEEIAKRLSSGFNSAVEFLYNTGYIDFLTRDEFWSVFGSDGSILHEIEKNIKFYEDVKYFFRPSYDNSRNWNWSPLTFTYENGKITGIGIWGGEARLYELEELPESIKEITSLKELILYKIGLKKIPKSILKLKSLKRLTLGYNNLRNIPEFLWNLENLESLDLRCNQLKSISEKIIQLKNLKILYLHANKLRTIPRSIENLVNLEQLILINNPLEKKTISFLENLQSAKGHPKILDL